MRHTRRTILKLGGSALAAASLAGCAPIRQSLYGSQPPLDGWPAPGAEWAALNRLTYGPRPEELRRAAETGLAGWIEEQLAPASLDDAALDRRLRGLDSLGLAPDELEAWEPADVIGELRQATLLRRVYSRRQLYELMVEFWTDHFNIFIDKGDCWMLQPAFDRQVIRRHALGGFRELLQASARGPAMLVYLDNQANLAAAPNENYARELLELHSLGVDGGYDQRDVMELARCLTGWTVKRHFWLGEWTFEPAVHAPGDKTVLGRRIAAGDHAEAEQVIDMLAAHESTARFIAGKLARWLIADEPPPALVARAADAFARSGGDIAAALRVILLDGLATMKELAPKIKRPQQFVAAALRQLNADSDGGPALQSALAAMGQPLFGHPTPDGYADRAAAWEGNLLPRWQFALALARNEIPGTTIDLADLRRAAGEPARAEQIDQLSRWLLGAELPREQRRALLAALAGGDESDQTALALAALLASPQFQWR